MKTIKRPKKRNVFKIPINWANAPPIKPDNETMATLNVLNAP